jgi:hypothetical protein
MSASSYRVVVVGSLLSSFFVGLHMPLLHEVIEHGASPYSVAVIVTILLFVVTAAGGWALLRQARRQ